MKTGCIGLTDFPAALQHIPTPPKQLWVRGEPLSGIAGQPCLAVIGSRAVSPYGRMAIQYLLPELCRYGVVIVSGLALGTDALAHRCALEHGGTTIAVLPASVNEVYPASHRQLAQTILDNGGTLVSEYPDGTPARREHFIARNRIVSGISQAVLIIEAAEKSGTLHTANFALEQGRDVLVVPGNITSAQSAGTNNLLKAGATPVTNSKDILRALGLEVNEKQIELFANSPEEAVVLDLMRQGVTEGAELLRCSQLNPSMYHQTMTMLELSGAIKSLGADTWTIN